MDKEYALRLADDIESICDDIKVFVFCSKDYAKECLDFFGCKRVISSTVRYREPLERIISWMTRTDEQTRDILSKIQEAGEIKDLRTFKKLKKVMDKLGGRAGGSGFFFVMDILFIEYDGAALCLINGSND